MFFHNSLDELHKHVRSDILPNEFGGQGGPFNNTEVHEAIIKHERYFKEVREMADKYNNKVKQ